MKKMCDCCMKEFEEKEINPMGNDYSCRGSINLCRFCHHEFSLAYEDFFINFFMNSTRHLDQNKAEII